MVGAAARLGGRAVGRRVAVVADDPNFALARLEMRTPASAMLSPVWASWALCALSGSSSLATRGAILKLTTLRVPNGLATQ